MSKRSFYYQSVSKDSENDMSLDSSQYLTHRKPSKKKPTKPRQPKLGLVRDIERLWTDAREIIDEYQLDQTDELLYKKGLEAKISE